MSLCCGKCGAMPTLAWACPQMAAWPSKLGHGTRRQRLRQQQLMRRWWGTSTIAALAVCLAVGSWSRQACGREPPSEPPAGSIRPWIRELDSDRFVVREAATRSLVRAGREAIGPVTEAATGGSLEVSCRAFQILMKLTQAGDRQTEEAALAALEQIAASPNEPAGRRAVSVVRWYRAERRQRALAEIRRLGAAVLTQADGTVLLRVGNGWKGAEADLARLKELQKFDSLSLEQSSLGDTALPYLKDLTDLKRLYLGNSRVTGSGLSHLKDLPNLIYLSLLDLKIEGSALKHVAEMPRLEYLGLDGTPVTDADLPQLKKLTSLKRLWLDRTNVTDAGLAYLQELKGLERLDLVSTRIDGSGLAELKDLGNLNSLSLKGIKLSDAGARALAHLTQLESLGLDDTSASDAQLAHLASLSNLKALWLTNTQVTDAGLAHIKRLTSLQNLYLQGTKVTAAGLAELKETLPGCRVYR